MPYVFARYNNRFMHLDSEKSYQYYDEYECFCNFMQKSMNADFSKEVLVVSSLDPSLGLLLDPLRP